MKKSIVGLCLVLFSALAWALPTLQQVESEIGQGHYTQAESMMAEVVAAKPASAKAHYVYAELLAHNANFTKAAEQAARAKELDPKIAFTDPAKFASFEQTLQRELHPAPRAREATPSTARPASSSSLAPQVAPVESTSRSGIPGWVWLAGLAVLAVVLWRGFSRSRSAPPAAMATAGGPGGYGPGPSYGPGMGMNPGPGYGPGGGMAPASRPGSGLLGTGLAVGAGVAGGMLIDEMLHRRGDGGGSNAGNNIGGFDPEGYRPSSADQAAGDLESRPIDFGNGNDWDSGGSSDAGDSGGGGGWD